MPSYLESLSMVALEAWAMGKPVLANAKCDVLQGQCLRSNAGLFYENYRRVRRDDARDRYDAEPAGGARPQRPRLLRAALRVAGDREEVRRHAAAAVEGIAAADDGADAGLVRPAAPDAAARGSTSSRSCRAGPYRETRAGRARQPSATPSAASRSARSRSVVSRRSSRRAVDQPRSATVAASRRRDQRDGRRDQRGHGRRSPADQPTAAAAAEAESRQPTVAERQSRRSAQGRAEAARASRRPNGDRQSRDQRRGRPHRRGRRPRWRRRRRALDADGAPPIHQVLATLGYGDAIGHEVLGIQRVLRGAGYESEIFVQTADPRLEDLTQDYRDLPMPAIPTTS